MNRNDIRLLQQMRGHPALTITLPTHRTSPENKQDPVRLKNLVTEATNRLLTDFDKRELAPLLQRLEQLAASVDFRATLDGLALYVNHDFARAFYLPFTLKERVVVDETFLTRDLVYALNHSPRYWVLALSEKPTRLYEGLRENLTEIADGGFPMTHTGPGGEAALPGGFGVQKSAYRDERHRQFFRQVDGAFKPFIAEDALSLVLVGVDRYLAFFNEVSAHSGAIIATVTGNHDKTSAHELGRRVWPLVEANLRFRRQQTLADLEKAVSERRFVSTIGEVWRLAHEGRGHTLLVEEDYHYPARVDATGIHPSVVEKASALDVIDDAVDDIIETVLDFKGQVVFVDNGDLSQHGRIALIVRY